MRGSELALVAWWELLLEARPMHCGTPALLHALAWLVSKLGVNHSGQLRRYQTGAGAAHLAAANALHLTLDPRPDRLFSDPQLSNIHLKLCACWQVHSR